jgi:hypothetical protein
MTTIPLTDLYTALSQAVRYYPAPSDAGRLCDRLQTFRVFGNNQLQNLTTDSIGASVCDKDKPYFYSRKWEAMGFNPNKISWEWPLAYAYPVRYTVENLRGKYIKRANLIEVGVLHLLPEGKGCTGCDGRNENEVFQDASTQLMAVLNYLSGMGYYTVNPTHEDARLYHAEMLQAAQDAGSINSFDLATGLLKGAGASTDNLTFEYVERYAERVFGVSVALPFVSTECVDVAYDFTAVDFGVLAHEANKCRQC